MILSVDSARAARPCSAASDSFWRVSLPDAGANRSAIAAPVAAPAMNQTTLAPESSCAIFVSASDIILTPGGAENARDAVYRAPWGCYPRNNEWPAGNDDGVSLHGCERG